VADYQHGMAQSLSWLDVASGRAPSLSVIHKFGRNSDVDTGTLPEDIWSQGGVWVPPTTARIHDIVSTDAADAAAGTGARTILVFGLNASFAEQSETVTMNGVTPVATANAYTRIYRMYLLTAGSSHINAGVITATAQTDATVTAAIELAEGQTQMAIFTVPAGKTAYMTQYHASIIRQGATAGAMADVYLYSAGPVDTTDYAIRARHNVGVGVTGAGDIRHEFDPPRKFTEKTDLWLRVNYVSDNNTHVTGGFDLVLEDS